MAARFENNTVPARAHDTVRGLVATWLSCPVRALVLGMGRGRTVLQQENNQCLIKGNNVGSDLRFVGAIYLC